MFLLLGIYFPKSWAGLSPCSSHELPLLYPFYLYKSISTLLFKLSILCQQVQCGVILPPGIPRSPQVSFFKRQPPPHSFWCCEEKEVCLAKMAWHFTSIQPGAEVSHTKQLTEESRCCFVLLKLLALIHSPIIHACQPNLQNNKDVPRYGSA